jgi:hypothetical protein
MMALTVRAELTRSFEQPDELSHEFGIRRIDEQCLLAIHVSSLARFGEKRRSIIAMSVNTLGIE